MTARDQRALEKLTLKLTRIEERTVHIRRLVKKRLGFREEEEFIKHEISKFHNKTTQLTKKKEIVKMMMREKQRDNIKHGKKIRSLRNKTLGEIENTLGQNSRP